MKNRHPHPSVLSDRIFLFRPERLTLYRVGVLLAACVGFSASAGATLLVHESFNYGDTTMAINGVTATGQGLAGSYSTAGSTAVGTGSFSANYSTTNLTFGSNFLASSGGSLQLSATGQNGANNATARADVEMNLAASQTGTLYNSYLVRFSSQNSNDAASTGAAIFDTNNRFMSSADAGVNSGEANRRPGVAYGTTTATAAGNTALSNGVTYLVLASYTNVGTALSGASPGVANLWVFTQAGYDAWFDAGAQQSDLGLFDIGFVSQSLTSGTYGFEDGDFLRFFAGSGANGASGTQTAWVDELRWGTTLADVVAVPEPGVGLLFGLGLGTTLLVRRRFSRE